MKIWIGRRESDILTVQPNAFDISITYYGSNDNKNYAYEIKKRGKVKYDILFYNYIVDTIKKITYLVPDYEIYFYNSGLGEHLEMISPDLKNHFVNINNYTLLKWLNNKSYTRLWLSNCVDVPPFALLSKTECTYEQLHNRFDACTEFILQKNYSSGGSGTYHMSKQNFPTIYNQLQHHEPYLVAPYMQDTISACCHVIIGENDTLQFPIGYQCISSDADTMNYLGTTYIENIINERNYEAFKIFISKISNKLSNSGYRGICGYDFLIQSNNFILIEINPRFMASSFILNYALERARIPSLFELNNMAFKGKPLLQFQSAIKNLSINFESCTIYQKGITNPPMPHTYELLMLDGYDKTLKVEEGGYLYRYIINR